MSDPNAANSRDTLDPVHVDPAADNPSLWTDRLVLFLRVMAGVSMLKGLFHWSEVIGLFATPETGFEAHSLPWQTATVFFAVIDLIAAVGLWLVAPWGAVVWLISIVSMAAVEILFPLVYGGRMPVVIAGIILLGFYLCLALLAARERPP